MRFTCDIVMHLRVCAFLQGIADLSMGEQFRELAQKITQDVHGVLSGTPLAQECPLDDVKECFRINFARSISLSESLK